MPAKRKATFAEIVAEVLAAPPVPLDVRPGGLNASGQFFDESGNLLELKQNSISPADALKRVQAGASVAFEGCGCGGYFGGCSAEWLAPSVVERLRSEGKPRFVKGYGSPTWIDVWASDQSEVVYLHGDVQWGDALPS